MRTEPTITAAGKTAARVKGLIASQDRTRGEVATALGLSEAALGRRLRVEVPFDVTELHTLADLFGVSAASLIEVAQ